MPNVASQIVAVATEADYRIDPTRWGSAAVAAHFPGFQHLDIRTSGAMVKSVRRGAILVLALAAAQNGDWPAAN